MINITEELVTIDYKKNIMYRLFFSRIIDASKAFVKIYNKFISYRDITPNLDDFIIALRTHLLLKGYSSKVINRYISKVIDPKLQTILDDIKKKAADAKTNKPVHKK